ncbi:hypothetical protein [Ruminococcus champanellensis]|uniref:hypothetical protein n=1 Tax=Ruminococcus champanellensis TaxID=1161942 RepID=UPI0026DAFC88|nr:hypothetical protein [Ruminococcus champanellensis]
MGALKDAGIRSLQDNLAAYDAARKQEEKQDANSLKSLFDAYLTTKSKAKRERMLKEFSERRLEFAAYLQAHPELVAAETKRALITAALGGEYVETETGVDSAGRRHKRRRVRQAAPNLQAILQLLDATTADAEEGNTFLDAIEKAGESAWEPK